MSNSHVDHARAFMNLMRDFRQPNPEGDHYEGMLECDVRDLAQGAALLIEATAKSLPQWLFLPENDVEQLKVRISNLEAQNENLRVNNAVLRGRLTIPSSLVADLNEIEKWCEAIPGGSVEQALARVREFVFKPTPIVGVALDDGTCVDPREYEGAGVVLRKEDPEL